MKAWTSKKSMVGSPWFPFTWFRGVHTIWFVEDLVFGLRGQDVHATMIHFGVRRCLRHSQTLLDQDTNVLLGDGT